MDNWTIKGIAGGLGIAMVVGILWTRDDIAEMKAGLHRPSTPGEPPHTPSETGGNFAGLLESGTVVGSTATATARTYSSFWFGH